MAMAFKADTTCMAHLMQRVSQQKEGFGGVLRLTCQCTSPRVLSFYQSLQAYLIYCALLDCSLY